ncbi:uncharacterized protein N7484_000763 [Penicillium longicatenatum]|uniref:uncharacterized protein n=1 Tax=Penicillium longicatenatum TaxID=1561947 RepID=UPI002546AEFB|nr:uncharacterized protein N7484_000763 [Penicillium longicatenatum]KAJ5657114.1 hypothetical protein N7484_000763 [Penicillium longicatenatum]
MSSWLPIPKTSPFSLQNIPFGIISTRLNEAKVPAVAIGDHVLDLNAFSLTGGFDELPMIHPHIHVFRQSTLNDFAALGRPYHRAVRAYLQSVFKTDTPFPALLKDNQAAQDSALHLLSDVTSHMPLRIGDYSDFYGCVNHAVNVGTLMRGPDNALQPNYKHLPVAYHGRASSIVVSGTPIRRPNGQILPAPNSNPQLMPCKRLDIELEMAAFISTPNEMGEPIPISRTEDHIFGLVLMNDWSARDIQAWEYIPLGPFNAKNFATTISPWVVLIDALEPFRTRLADLTEGGPSLSYLRGQGKSGFDIDLEVELTTQSGAPTILSKTNSKNLSYSFNQMVAHHTIGGCNMNPGDLLGSGTISGTMSGSEGSLLEKTKGKGKTPISLSDGGKRFFVEDGDTITIRGLAGTEGNYVGFGECVGTILPAFSVEN